MILRKTKHPETLILHFNRPGQEPFTAYTVNKTIFDYLRARTSTVSPQERLVILAFDEFFLSDVLPKSYNEPKDGDITPPKSCIVFAIRWVVGNLHQPIATLFFHGQPHFAIANSIKMFIEALKFAGLIVVATVCPGSDFFVRCIEELVQVWPLKSANGPIVYSVREIKNIVHIFDPPILLVNVRNLLAYHQAAFTRKGMNFMADWEDIHFWSEMTKETKLKYAELIDFKTKHLVKTSFASKIFSRSVSKGICDAILKGQCKLSELGTAEFCLFFNDLFDTCNVSKEDKTGLRCRITQNSPHLTFWDEAIYVLESVRFVIYVNGFPSKIAKLMNKHREPKRSMSNSNGKESFVLVNEGFSVETIEPEVPKNLLPELLECQKLVTKLNILQEANKNKIKKRKSGGSLEQSISELRKLYKSSPLPISELKETQTLVPDFIRLWILNCYGFKALVNNLREAGITEVYTKYFNVDNIQDFMKKIRIANGMESLEVTENAEYPLLDPEMAKCALRPMVGCIILRN